MKMFGRISVPFWTAMFTWSYPIQDATGNSPATIERIFGAGVQVNVHRHTMLPLLRAC